MSLRITPQTNYSPQTSNTSKKTPQPHLRNGAPSAPGLPDTLRSSLTAAPETPGLQNTNSTHPLEARLLNWRQTQDAMKMESIRRIHGMAEPVRRGMEMKIVRDSQWKPAVLGGNMHGSIHEDILALGGRETEVTWEDVYPGDELREPPSFHDELEHRLKMN
ncbi:hypothetical protein H109_02654 [Trichophyton interdigitale MR816]|uniref:Proteasome maturation factor UMP1 n=1 Tax=Trichophyton interdigitale (strain MR816) TaxID=1215338 RepID=A0A059JCL4_TRIIM|nr:hypothetical protein H101_01622 [Trichophyton interdigitale H6]KDB25544.1 hypothetical protein H109_02654 [Trichophyton interdigitale MR816]